MSAEAKHLHKILYGDTNFPPVTKKDLKVLNFTKLLLDSIMDSYKGTIDCIYDEKIKLMVEQKYLKTFIFHAFKLNFTQ